ncbi:MAG: anhydro-N-acetylmuramic acid kinase [Xanthomonadales bacterium]|nr:anhydro-N-acetylmuramic acid kinase [Xanthomonadales bacterium]NIX11683.1 anhydro-N-acetylmuramic acid kinase [Xanthomonadales bacterium]
MNGDLYIGLISGTSRDGVDAALVHFEGDRPRLLHAICMPIGEPLKSGLDDLLEARRPPSATEASTLDEFLGRLFAKAARAVAGQAGVEMQDVVAIGSHGQTVWHDPDGDEPVSLQLGNPGVIARSTGVTTVADFRSADLLAGGQGAPLAPLLHRELFHDTAEDRAVLNLGGIANLTFLPGSGSISGFDTGPANCLMDLWSRRHLDRPFDRDGAWAAAGTPDDALLEALLEEPYFDRPPPKSTGLEHFNARWLESRLADREIEAGDVQGTLAELTARTVADGVLRHGPRTHRLLVCGGGSHNTHLMHLLAVHLPDTIVESTSRHGVNPDWIEAVLFAWLGRERLLERPQDTRLITGAQAPVLLGDIHTTGRD